MFLREVADRLGLEGYGDSEDLIGEWFERTGKRDEVSFGTWQCGICTENADVGVGIQVFLATKFGVNMIGDRRIMSNDPDYIRKAIDTSLNRLKTNRVDLWYWYVITILETEVVHCDIRVSLLIHNSISHRFTGKIPVETVVSTMGEAVKAGKVSHLGLSECSANTLRRACAIHPIAAVQIEYSPFTMDIEDPAIGLLQACRDLGVATVAYSPLGRGMLTGQYKSNKDFEEGDWRRTAPRFSDENFPKNLQLVEKLGEVARSKGCTTGQLTLAWLMRQGEDVFPIPGYVLCVSDSPFQRSFSFSEVTRRVRMLTHYWSSSPEQERLYG